MNNTIRKIYTSCEISKSDARRFHLKTVKDIVDWVLAEDTCPKLGTPYPIDEVGKAEGDFPDSASVDTFSNNGVRFLEIGFTCLEKYTSDEDGFLVGSDYDEIADFSEEQIQTINEFLN